LFLAKDRGPLKRGIGGSRGKKDACFGVTKEGSEGPTFHKRGKNRSPPWEVNSKERKLKKPYDHPQKKEQGK